MARDSLFGERIIWMGRPAALAAPPVLRAAAALAFTASVVATLFAVVVAEARLASPAGLLLFAAWAATVGLGLWYGPRIWLEQARYLVTDRHVVTQRGPFRRSIERDSISFARVFWNPRSPGTGDLELVRAVQTGVWRRRLCLRLVGLTAPDRVLSIVRGTETLTPVGRRERPLAQRLDRGERVLWAARPEPRLAAYLPETLGGAGQLLLAALLAYSVSTLVWRGEHTARALLDAGLPGRSAVFVALVAAMSLTALFLLLFVAFLVHDSVFRAGRLVRDTRYLVTDRRVLIQRGDEELYLDRSRVVDVIDTPIGRGLHDLFLVLDGPQARALAASGAFGERPRSPSLHPVFHAVADADGASRILTNLPRAA